MRRSTLAAVSSATRAAPARFNAAAHTAAVDPVVMTSSISKTFLPANVCDAARARKAPATFFRRARSLSPACTEVDRTRRKAASSGAPVRRDSSRASSSDWLNPRRHRRHQWSGTGTIASKRSSRGSASASRSPKGPASVATLPYLKRWMRSRRTPSYDPKQ